MTSLPWSAQIARFRAAARVVASSVADGWHRLGNWLNVELELLPLRGWRWRAGLLLYLARRWALSALIYVVVVAILPSFLGGILLDNAWIAWLEGTWCPYGLLSCTKAPGCGGWYTASCRPLGVVTLYVDECGRRTPGDAFLVVALLAVTALACARWWRRDRASRVEGSNSRSR